MRTVHLSELQLPHWVKFVGNDRIDTNITLLMRGHLCASPIRTAGNIVVRDAAKLIALREIMLTNSTAFDRILPDGLIEVTDGVEPN